MLGIRNIDIAENIVKIDVIYKLSLLSEKSHLIELFVELMFVAIKFQNIIMSLDILFGISQPMQRNQYCHLKHSSILWKIVENVV